MVDNNIANKVFEKGVRKDMYTVEQDSLSNLYLLVFIKLAESHQKK